MWGGFDRDARRGRATALTTRVAIAVGLTVAIIVTAAPQAAATADLTSVSPTNAKVGTIVTATGTVAGGGNRYRFTVTRASGTITVRDIGCLPTGAGGTVTDSWTVPGSPANGEYRYNLFEYAGNAECTANTPSSSDSIPFNVDSVAPVPTITAPAAGALTNDDTPTIAGAALATDGVVTIRLCPGTNMSCGSPTTFTTTPGGGNTYSASVPSGSALATQGQWTVAVSQTDAAGNLGTSATTTFTLDTLAPILAITSPAAGSTTADNTPTITGTSDQDSELAVVLCPGTTHPCGGSAVVFGGVASGGTFTATVPSGTPLADGQWTAQANQTDPAWNNGTTQKVTFTVDTTAPTLTLTAPAAGSTTSDTTPLVEGTASETSDVTIRICAGATMTCAGPSVTFATTPSAGNFSVSVPNASALPDGQWTARASQTDAAGHTGFSNTRTFTVDATGPTLTVDTPADGSFTNDNTPNVSGETDEASLVTIQICTGAVNCDTSVSFDGVISGETYSGSPTVPLADGVYRVRASQTDAAGNTTTTPFNTFTVDTVAPSVTLTAPLAGAATNDTTPTIAGTAPDGTVTITLCDGPDMDCASPTSFTTPASGGMFSAPSSTLAEGEWTVRASQTDAAGNTGSAILTFSVDTTGPDLTLTAPVDGSITNDRTPAFSGGTDTAGDVTVTVCPYPVCFATIAVFTATPSGSSWAASVPTDLADGLYFAWASQSDALGNTSTSGNVLFSIDATGPEVAVTAPTNGSTTTDTTPTVSGNVSEAGPGSVTISYCPGATFSCTPTTFTLPLSGTSFSGDWANTLAPGTYTFNASHADAVGNLGGSDDITFTVLPVPTVTVTSPTAGSTISDNTPNITGTASGTSDVTVQFCAGSIVPCSGMATFTTPVTSGNWLFGFGSPLNDGVYSVKASQTNGSGTGSSPVVTFTIDAPAPTVALTSPANGSTTADSTPTFSGSATDTSTVTVVVCPGSVMGCIGGLELTASVVTGTFSVDAPTPLADGQYTAQAYVGGPGGNGQSSGNTFTIDTTAPTVTLTAPVNGSATTDTTPPLSGAANAADGDVTIRICIGAAAGCAVPTVVTATPSSGAYTVDAPALAVGQYTAQASQTDAAGNTGTSSANTFNVTSIGPAPLPEVNLSVVKTDGVATVKQGATTTYTITVANDGPAVATGVRVTDTLPAGIASATWTCATGTGGGVCQTPSGTGSISHFVDLPAISSVVFTLQAQVRPSATGTLTNTASVNVPAGRSDPNVNDNSHSDTNTITYQQALPGVVTGSTAFGLRNSLTTGPAETSFTINGVKPLVPLMGDWNGDGVKTAGYFKDGTFRLFNNLTANDTPTLVTFGNARGYPLAGDFDGDGLDDLAVFLNGSWQIRYSDDGATPAAFNFGSLGTWPTVVPVVGDWNGDGIDGIGTYQYASGSDAIGTWKLRNSADAGSAAVTFVQGGASNAYPVVGDWDANGTDTFGHKTGNVWCLRNANAPSTSCPVSFTYGGTNDLPVVWRND